MNPETAVAEGWRNSFDEAYNGKHAGNWAETSRLKVNTAYVAASGARWHGRSSAAAFPAGNCPRPALWRFRKLPPCPEGQPLYDRNQKPGTKDQRRTGCAFIRGARCGSSACRDLRGGAGRPAFPTSIATKMGWLDNPYRHTATEAADFSYPPNGGRAKLVTLGIVLPIGVLIYAAHIWITSEAYWPGRRGSGMTVTGETARAMSVGWVFLGLFCHFRWFWGLFFHYLTFRIGTTISLLGMLGSGGASFYFLFR